MTNAASVIDALWERGYAIAPTVLRQNEIDDLKMRYEDDCAYRNIVVMSRHNFGSGEYRYYKDPLPPVVQSLREQWYGRLAPVANAWNEATRVSERYPATLAEYIRACKEAGQTRSTPLILRYREGDYNNMHQDVYGALGFPFQLTIPLSIRGSDFAGGETVLLEQAPRLQARPTVLQPQAGDALIFPNRYLPRKGKSGAWVRYTVRHGVSPLMWGERFALGVIFHDAQ